ncbi:C-type natriuretic peptide [Sylvia borin]
MQISPLLAGGLLLALLSVRLEAKPASQLPQKASRGSAAAAAAAAAGPPEAAERKKEREKEREKERSGGGGGSGPREAREARAEARPRAGWARLLQDPPGRRHKGLHKKGLGKGCFGLKLDRIGAMSGLGC